MTSQSLCWVIEDIYSSFFKMLATFWFPQQSSVFNNYRYDCLDYNYVGWLKKNLTKFVNHWKMIKPLLIFVSFSIILNILFLKDIVFSYKFKWEFIIRILYKILPMSLTWALAFSWWIRCLCRSCALVLTSMVLSILIVLYWMVWRREL